MSAGTSSRVDNSIRGIQEVQQANQQMLAALRPSGALGQAVQGATLDAQRYAITITHVGKYRRGRKYIGGGSLRASHRVEMNGKRGRVYIDPDSVNPVTRAKPSEYGVYEHARGYPHNFYERTVIERGNVISQNAINRVRNAFP